MIEPFHRQNTHHTPTQVHQFPCTIDKSFHSLDASPRSLCIWDMNSFFWWAVRDSNPQPSDYESHATNHCANGPKNKKHRADTRCFCITMPAVLSYDSYSVHMWTPSTSLTHTFLKGFSLSSETPSERYPTFVSHPTFCMTSLRTRTCNGSI